ncbi:A/G-specific adenine glycosylase [Candidimonas sp. SYP-B2681]|uniref:A/G-specific adenine glycosylase n=1 Tax=Candidimonas sp. SYP-B2681 TaxID=2497686 RepID=UPI000F86DCEF|nr:A/G-specific adenine glycosylase [Candidimonas sp. SYP-B2681]RTZ45785.1 A/G-specific adenine glycosylase [Candidimonas sp. SYP-B2681]
MVLNSAAQLPFFASRIVNWQKDHGRHHLPWQGTHDPYKIWLSEIMLQQTQVATVMGYYERFLSRFPDIASLAAAEQDEVMPYWAGLGYYARARNLHRCARQLVAEWEGAFPTSSEQIATLPGIGRSTAAAIAAFSYGERSPIMDGNVKRVFTRYFGIYGISSQRLTEQVLWQTAGDALAAADSSLDMAAYTQGLMDLGSDCCTRTRPDCARCPLQESCYAHEHSVQHELPTPKPKKTPPERECTMLILQQHESILLERQVSPGIWGGLWSLPKYDDASALHTACSNWGQSYKRSQKMAGLLHVFSHFKLHIEPWYVQCDASSVAEPGPRQAWVPIEHLPSTALPAPVKKILSGLFDL